MLLVGANGRSDGNINNVIGLENDVTRLRLYDCTAQRLQGLDSLQIVETRF